MNQWKMKENQSQSENYSNCSLWNESRFFNRIWYIYKYPKHSMVVNIYWSLFFLKVWKKAVAFTWEKGKKLKVAKGVKRGKLEQAHNRSGIAISLKSTLLSLDAYRSDKYVQCFKHIRTWSTNKLMLSLYLIFIFDVIFWNNNKCNWNQNLRQNFLSIRFNSLSQKVQINFRSSQFTWWIIIYCQSFPSF